MADPLEVAVPSAKVAELRELLKEELSSDDGRATVDALGGDPHALERVLVARQLNATAAATMFRSTLRFRRDEVAKLMPIDPSIKSKVSPHWPVAYLGRTGDGKPLQLVRLGGIDPKRLLEQITEEEFRTYYIHWVELSLRHQAACGNARQVEIYDLKGLSLSQMYIPGIRMLSRVFKLGQEHYPESLHRCIVIHAPRVFAIAWSIVSLVLHERTRAKTIILSGDGLDVLTDVLRVDRAEVEAHLASDATSDVQAKEGLKWLGSPERARTVGTEHHRSQDDGALPVLS